MKMVRMAQEKDIPILAELALLLWPSHERNEMITDLTDLMQQGAAFFLAEDGDLAVGFAQCQLRRDYVEGTQSSPVGYLEGIFVREGYRRQGIAKMLLSACEAWSREKGCCEFASDCELWNEESLLFHLHMGFSEANRIICFAKQL